MRSKNMNDPNRDGSGKSISDEDILRLVGRNIESERKGKRLTQQELAEMVRVSCSEVSLIERGKVSPKFLSIVKIAQKLEVSVDQLLGDREMNERIRAYEILRQRWAERKRNDTGGDLYFDALSPFEENELLNLLFMFYLKLCELMHKNRR